MLGEVTELYDDAVSYFRVKRLNRVIENAAMYRGWHQIARDGNYEMGVTDPQGEANEGINIARMLTKAAVAQTLKQVPTIEVPAAKDDQKARAKADMTEKLARSILRRVDQDELHRTVSWDKQTGAAWLKVSWDMQSGRALPQDYDGFTDEEEEARYSDDGFGAKAEIQLYEGDVRYEFVPTTDGYPDPAAKTRKEMHHFFHEKLLPVRKLDDMFPVDYFGEPTTGRWETGATESSAMASSFAAEDDFLRTSAAGNQSDGNTFAKFVEFWELPSRAFPRGRFISFSGSMIIAMGPNPYFPTRIPFVLFMGDNIVPGALYADGLLEDVKSLQYSTNRAANKMREHLDKMLNVHMLVPKNSGVDKNIWGDKAGQIIEYQKGYKPEPLEIRDIPQGMFEFQDNQINRAQSVTGYTDVGRGDAQSDLSGRAVAFYTENETALREPDMIAHKRSMLEVIQNAIYLYRQFADDGRLMHMIGDNGKLELVEFLEDDYDWENDFVPEIYTGRPASRAARMSEVIELLGAGVFGDGPEFDRARKLLGDDYAYASSVDPFQRDRARARRECLSHLKDPMSVLQVQTYDTHQIHLEEHREYMRTPEFEALPDWQKKAMFIHDELHELMMQGADAAFLQAQQGPQTPPGPEPMPPGVESPPDGGASQMAPSAPPTIEQFADSSDSEQRSLDQQ